MGVMSCSRRKCGSIMCDTYVDSVGYVCNECQQEFKEFVQANELDVDSEGKILEGKIQQHLKEFMKTDKGFLFGKKTSIEDFFKEYTH